MGVIRQMRNEAWLQGLRALCRDHVSTNALVVEVGSFAGESTAVFAEFARQVIAIDPWSTDYSSQVMLGCASEALKSFILESGLEDMGRIEAQFRDRVSRFSNVSAMKMKSSEAVGHFANESIDLVYIDSIHTEDEVAQCIREWLPKIRPAGVLSGHDYSEAWPGVILAVDSLLGRPPFIYGDTSWAVPLSLRLC